MNTINKIHFPGNEFTKVESCKLPPGFFTEQIFMEDSQPCVFTSNLTSSTILIPNG